MCTPREVISKHVFLIRNRISLSLSLTSHPHSLITDCIWKESSTKRNSVTFSLVNSLCVVHIYLRLFSLFAFHSGVTICMLACMLHVCTCYWFGKFCLDFFFSFYSSLHFFVIHSSAPINKHATVFFFLVLFLSLGQCACASQCSVSVLFSGFMIIDILFLMVLAFGVLKYSMYAHYAHGAHDMRSKCFM